MAKSPRHSRLAAAKAEAAKTFDYEITDAAAMPDARGEFGGAKVRYDKGKKFVNMTENQARFYLDQGALVQVKTG